MTAFSRADDSLLARWWWTVDRWMLLLIGLLFGTGLILSFSASTAMADRLGAPDFYFTVRQGLYILVSAGVMLGISLLPVATARRVAILVLPVALLLTLLTLAAGSQYQGASRWLSLGGVSLQPSEILKPAFIVVSAWLISLGMQGRAFPGHQLALVTYGLCAVALILQPDYGQTFLLGMVLGLQFLISGLSLVWIGGLVLAGLVTFTLAYLYVPHVHARVAAFLDPAAHDTYQIDRALEAFRHGGLIGAGPGEGVVKQHLPDAHSDFIFALAGEEFGSIACLGIVAVFSVIVLRGLMRVSRADSPFVVLAVGGLLSLFGLQALINMATSLMLIPPKGMTLPFISYGGSSMLGFGLAMGLVLALTRGLDIDQRLPAGRWRWA